MDEENKPYRENLHEALELLNGRWTVAVLMALALGEVRSSELLTKVNEACLGWPSHPTPLSRRTLTDTLASAQDNGLVVRRAEEQGRFKGVWYSLTPEGEALLVALRPLASWMQQHNASRSSSTS